MVGLCYSSLLSSHTIPAQLFICVCITCLNVSFVFDFSCRNLINFHLSNFEIIYTLSPCHVKVFGFHHTFITIVICSLLIMFASSALQFNLGFDRNDKTLWLAQKY